MSDLDIYSTYVSRDVIEPLYKNSYRGYIPAFNQFVNNIDNLIMADIEQGNALRIHARHISVLYSNIATLRAEKDAEIATLRAKITDLSTALVDIRADIAELRKAK